MGTVNDFVAFVLSKYSKQLKAEWLKISPVNPPSDIQTDVIKVNNFLRIQLGLLEVDTTSARECLVMEPSFDAWARNFEKGVAPTIARYGLPAWNKSNAHA